MSPTFAKLNLKDQSDIVVVNAPASFEPEIASLRGVMVRRRTEFIKMMTRPAEYRYSEHGGARGDRPVRQGSRVKSQK
jgi:hypothetical protein